jgi:hypothetical protein
MNLVMIGRFNAATDAASAKEAIDQLTEQAGREDQGKRETERYSGTMLDLLVRLNVLSISPGEVEQLRYDVSVRHHDKEVRVTTDECDVSAYLKVLLDKGARIEVYSAHHYPDAAKQNEK